MLKLFQLIVNLGDNLRGAGLVKSLDKLDDVVNYGSQGPRWKVLKPKLTSSTSAMLVGATNEAPSMFVYSLVREVSHVRRQVD